LGRPAIAERKEEEEEEEEVALQRDRKIEHQK